MTTPQLWQSRHTDQHRALAELVLRLRDQSGLEFARIADELNSSGQLSPRGKPFYPELVYSIYRARKVVVLTDASKFGRVSLHRIALLDQVETVITDAGISSEYREGLQRLGIEVIVVDASA